MTLSTVERAEQAADIYQRRLAGATIREIAKEFHMSVSTVEARLKYYMEKRVAPGADEYRAITIDRLEHIIAKVEPLLNNNDPNVKVKAAEQIRKISMDLFDVHGLRMVKVEHSGSIATVSVPTVEQELEALSRELGLNREPI